MLKPHNSVKVRATRMSGPTTITHNSLRTNGEYNEVQPSSIAGVAVVEVEVVLSNI